MVASCIAGYRMASQSQPGFAFLKQGETIYSSRIVASNAPVTESYTNLPIDSKEAIKRIRQELPNAIERHDSEGQLSFVLPQMEGGRVLITEFPIQAISVRPGRLVRFGNRILVSKGSTDKWSNVQVLDYREPSALESAVHWLGDQMGI